MRSAARERTGGVLPASGKELLLRPPRGEDELFVLESTARAEETMLALAGRLAADQATSFEWDVLPAVDLGAAALMIRRLWLADTLTAEALCPVRDCGEAIDIAFSISEYLDHHRPRRYRQVADLDGEWFALTGTDVRFRIPTIADQTEALAAPDPGQTLRERCIRPAEAPGSVARRIDRALDALAPRLDGLITGLCPECGQTVRLRFEPISYVLAELRDASGSLFAQVHQIALAYHWSEERILALDRRRRHQYVALIQEEPALA